MTKIVDSEIVDDYFGGLIKLRMGKEITLYESTLHNNPVTAAISIYAGTIACTLTLTVTRDNGQPIIRHVSPGSENQLINLEVSSVRTIAVRLDSPSSQPFVPFGYDIILHWCQYCRA